MTAPPSPPCPFCGGALAADATSCVACGAVETPYGGYQRRDVIGMAVSAAVGVVLTAPFAHAFWDGGRGTAAVFLVPAGFALLLAVPAWLAWRGRAWIKAAPAVQKRGVC